jgi:hypothetical protein
MLAFIRAESSLPQFPQLSSLQLTTSIMAPRYLRKLRPRSSTSQVAWLAAGSNKLRRMDMPPIWPVKMDEGMTVVEDFSPMF